MVKALGVVKLVQKVLKARRVIMKLNKTKKGKIRREIKKVIYYLNFHKQPLQHFKLVVVT